MLELNQIRALHIELTTNCNARCPMCMRNYRGYNYNSGYPITELSLPEIKKIFSITFLDQIKYINFNGNLGDFGLAKDAVEIVEYFLQNSQAKIQIETNGSMRSPSWWATLSNPRIQILWALDGLADTHGLYRQDTEWQRVIDNAQAHIRAGGNSVWKFIPFEHNKHQLEQCRSLSKELGFADFVIYDQGRNQGPVFSRKGEFSHWLGTPQSQVPDLGEMLESHVTWFDNNKVPNWIRESAPIDCEHLRTKELYIAADGTVYPCCWLGFYPESMNQAGNSQFRHMVKKNNALKYDLNTCISWFTEVEKSWDKKTMRDGKLYSCMNNCSINP